MRTVRVGFTIEHFKGISPAVLIGLSRLLGVEFVEITHSVFEDIHRVIRNLKDIRTGFHLPLVHDDGWDLSCIERKTEIDDIIEKINTYREALNINYCVTHPPEPFQADELLRTSSDFLLTNLKKLRTPIFLENIQGQPMEDFLVLYKNAKEILGEQLAGICFDAAHCYLRKLDPVSQLRKLDGKVGCVHLSDCSPDDDAHMAFGLGGVLPVEEILNTLFALNYTGYITLEILPRTIDDLEPAILSYLTVLKKLRPWKYLNTRLRMLYVKPLIHRLIK